MEYNHVVVSLPTPTVDLEGAAEMDRKKKLPKTFKKAIYVLLRELPIGKPRKKKHNCDAECRGNYILLVRGSKHKPSLVEIMDGEEAARDE